MAFEASIQGDAFRVDEGEPIVTAFQGACSALTGAPLPKNKIDGKDILPLIVGEEGAIARLGSRQEQDKT